MAVKTPCIGVCSTGLGDSVCRGCKRFEHEVIHWNSYSDHEQQLVIDRLDTFVQQIVANMIEIEDEDKLIAQMRFQQIRFDESLSSSRWIYELLRSGASQIQSTEEFGFSLKSNWQRFNLEEIKQFLEQDFYALSSAHYERYIARI